MDEDLPRTYRIESSEIAEIEIEKAYLCLSTVSSVEVANRWVMAVRDACTSLQENPYRYAAVATRPGARRVLVGCYHILYRVVEASLDETQGIVRILNVFHATSKRAG